MSTQNIQIYDKEKLLSFSYNDLLSAHGGEMPGGVALVFKLMQWIFNDVAKEIPLRGTCSFYCGLGENGQGIIDGADHVMQIRKQGKLFLDLSYCENKDAPLAPGGGKYYFEIAFNNKKYAVRVKDNIIPKDFFDFSKYIHQKQNNSESLTADDTTHLQILRKSLAETILSNDAADLFLAEQIS